MDKGAFKEALLRDQNKEESSSEKSEKTDKNSFHQNATPHEKMKEDQRYTLNSPEQKNTLNGLKESYSSAFPFRIFSAAFMAVPYILSILILILLWITAAAIPAGGILALIFAAIKATFPGFIKLWGITALQAFLGGSVACILGFFAIKGMVSFTGFYMKKAASIIEKILSSSGKSDK